MLASAEFVQPPIRKKSVGRLVHFEMNLVPDRMVNSHYEHEHASSYRGKKEQYDRNR